MYPGATRTYAPLGPQLGNACSSCTGSRICRLLLVDLKARWDCGSSLAGFREERQYEQVLAKEESDVDAMICAMIGSVETCYDMAFI